MENSKESTSPQKQTSQQPQDTDPMTRESIQRGQDAIKVQQELNTDPEDKKQADAAKDAENWRNEG